MEINNHLEDEIDLRDLINHLIKSKIIIIITTFIFVLMAVSFNYLTPKPIPVYQSTAKLVIGHVFNKNYRNNHKGRVIHLHRNNLVDNLHFYFPEMTLISGSGEKFIEIKLKGPSIEKNTIKLKELIDYAINDSKEEIESIKQEIKLEISYIDMDIATIDYSLDKLLSIDSTNNVEMILHINDLIYRKKLFENKVRIANDNLETSLYLNTHTYGEIESRQINTSEDKSKINILFSAIAGLLLSIVALTFRYVFLKK